MKKDEVLKVAKEKFNVKLNPKEKLADLMDKLDALENNSELVEEPVQETSKRQPIASKGESGRVVRWNPLHREEYWTFIYDKRSLTKEELKKLGL
jgi:hypothetical protein|tara:strand:+ start:3099 stop:3383 length:285 start_codon:yes stop_codon:yes gene_type:complete